MRYPGWTRLLKQSTAFLCLLLNSIFALHAASIAIIIDDVGYRSVDMQVLQLPRAVAVAILPDSPNHRDIAERAHRQGREILIHMPMAPNSKQPLEKSTLFPTMSEQELAFNLQRAFLNIPYATGMNNHMGSAMTADLPAMKRVVRLLQQQHIRYFLDSKTVSNSQVKAAAMSSSFCILTRNIFLDNSLNERDIQRQLQQTIMRAQKKGSAIAIGHPHPETVRVLRQMLPQLPANVTLVKPGALINSARCGAVKGQEQPDSISLKVCPIVFPEKQNVSHEALQLLFGGIVSGWRH